MPENSVNKRTPLPRNVRFDILKRDCFTCQYCGSQAPSVALQVDHINPVATGGTNDEDNLITSCADCNVGKSAIPLEQALHLAAIVRNRLYYCDYQFAVNFFKFALDHGWPLGFLLDLAKTVKGWDMLVTVEIVCRAMVRGGNGNH